MLPESQFSLLNFFIDVNIKLITIKIFLIKLSTGVHVFCSAMKELEGLPHIWRKPTLSLEFHDSQSGVEKLRSKNV